MKFFIVAIIAAFAAWLGTPAWATQHPEEAQHELLVANTQIIQDALSKWSDDRHGNTSFARPQGGGYWFPHTITQLIVEGYLEAGIYHNPYTTGTRLNAHDVPPYWNSTAAGNFSYLTQYNEEGYVVGYILLGFGNQSNTGMDIDGDGSNDGVHMIMRGGNIDTPTRKIKWWHDTLPVLIDFDFSGDLKPSHEPTISISEPKRRID